MYRLTTELIDPEPKRSVIVRRKIDTKIPVPLLSSITQSSTPKIGGLANLRAPTLTPSIPTATSPAPSTVNPGGSWAKITNVEYASATPTESGSRTPINNGSRPITPVTGSLSAGISNTVHSRESSGRKTEAVVGQVGQVEDDEWDVDS